jgi:hypothetical protein
MPSRRVLERKRRRASARGGLAFPTPPAGPVFPSNTLALKVELLLNGTWTDVSNLVYQRDGLVIHRGRPDESSTMTVSTLALTFNNRNGNFSPKNTAGLYYPYIGRNTQIRLSVNTTSMGHDW